MCAENHDLQHLAKRAVVSYLRSVHLNKDKSVFKVDQINTELLSRAYGLVNAPQIEFVSKKEAKNDRVAMLKQQARERKEKRAL